MKFAKKRIATLSVLLLCMTGVFAQKGFFKTLPVGNLKSANAKTNKLKRAGFLQLDEQGMRTYLLAAPMEFRNNGRTVPLEIPLPNGKTETFAMVESPILSSAIAALHPEIKTYSGNGSNNKKSVIRISLTSEGLSAVILNVEGDAVYFEKYNGNNSRDTYFSYFTTDAIAPNNIDAPHRSCGMELINEGVRNSANGMGHRPAQVLNNTGGNLTTYRLAFAATGEFTGKHGGTATSGLAAIVGYVNRMTAVYRNELSVSFTLVSGTNLIYTNSGTDPYTGDNESTMLGENQTNVDAVIGSANYDIAHVLSWNENYGSGGGVAYSPSLGNDDIKAGGASIEGEAPYVQLFFDQLVFHEVGHMFGMSHSYNSNIPVCTTRRQATSAEPGSGATIMSYGFTCDSDDYGPGVTQGPILNFHTVSYDQAVAYMASIPTIGTITSTGNTPPVVTMPSNFTIPKSTPFSLTGSATDADGDALTYSWEGTNIGLVAVPDATVLADPSKPPFFRSYEPSAGSTTRTYPILSAILNGSNYAPGEKLPSIGIATTHRLTVRDNNPAGGGVSYGNVTVIVDGSVGPFLITNDLSSSYAALSTQTITWSVNGTNTATPNVKISLSTDGGQTFPITLVASTANDGSEVVTIPNNQTTTARIKVEAAGNIFFDISNADFTITAPVITNYDIVASSGANGTVTPAGTTSVASGANQTYTITANSCYAIADVLVDGVSQGAVGTYTFTNVTAAHTISATFSPITYSITASAGANGSISPNGATVVNCGTNQSYTITPNAGYNIQDVLVDGVSQGAITTYTFTNVTQAHTITASFTPIVACLPNTWTGATNTLWNEPTNWDCGTVPASGENVTIPDAANDPVLNTNVTVGTLSLAAGATLGIGSNTLTVNGAVSGTGTFTGSATSNLTTNATTTVRFTTGANSLKNLTVTAGTTTLGNALDITAGLSAGNAGTVTVSQGAVLASAGNLTFKSNEFGTARLAAGDIAGNYVTGNVTVERYIPNNNFRSWRLLSVPTSGSQTIRQAWQEGAANPAPLQNNLPNFGTQITGTGALATAQAAGFDDVAANAALFSWSGSAWVNASTTNTAIATNKGYFMFLRGERSKGVTGTNTNSSATTLRTTGLLYQGNQTSPALPANGFNLIGNLYASAIDFTALTRAGGVSNAFYIWDSKKMSGNSLGAYQTFSATNGFQCTLGGGSYTVGQPNTTIESGQAFFVQTTTTGTITLTEASKINSPGNLGFRPANSLVKIDSRLYSLSGNKEEIADANVVVFNNIYSNKVDANDAVKLANAGENFAVSAGGKTVAVEGRQELNGDDVIYFNMWNMKQQQYKLEFVPNNLGNCGLQAMLQDNYLKTSAPVSLTAVNSITFIVDANAASAAANRFSLVFKKPVSVNTVTKAGFTISPNPAEGNTVNVLFTSQPAGKYNIKLSGANGRLISSQVITHAGGTNIQVLNLPQAVAGGAYQLEIISAGKKSTTKTLVIKK